MALRSNFGSSRLVRLLGAWAPVDADASGMDLPERLSLWLDPFDAIELQATHQALRAMASRPAPAAAGKPPRAADLAADLQRVRAALAHAIAQEVLPLPEFTPASAQRLRRGQPEPAPADGGYGPYRQRHLELQRQMEQMIEPLRDHVRQALGRGSLRLRQLAVMDAALARVLAKREPALLPAATQLLERRFAQLRKAAPPPPEPSSPDEAPAPAHEPAPWLRAFESDWRQALRAEVDLRLEPVAGLIDALSNEPKT